MTENALAGCTRAEVNASGHLPGAEPQVMRDNVGMSSRSESNWNSIIRANASQKWRSQSASMGSSMTQAIVEAARVEPGMRVLDVACGTGEPSISLAVGMRGSGEVTGIDISSEPLKTAEERAQERGLANVKFQLADVHSLPFANESFDRITSRLGVMYFAELPRALSEMWRVLKLGGTATLLAWGPIEQPYFQTTIGTVLRFLPGAEAPESGKKVFVFGEAGLLPQAFRNARFTSVEERFVTLPYVWPGPPAEVWEYFQSVTVPFVTLLQSIPEAIRPQIDQAVLHELERYYDGQETKLTATVNITVAVK